MKNFHSVDLHRENLYNQYRKILLIQEPSFILGGKEISERNGCFNLHKYIYIGLGGFAGAILRYSIGQLHIRNVYEAFPLNTLFINISGAFLIALILTITFEIRLMDADVKLGITTGFLGAYTTFSTLCKETVALMFIGDYFSAISYIIVSVILGLGAAYLGSRLAHRIKTVWEK